jgi:hypothetical protein
MYRHLGCSQVPTVCFDFRLKKMTARLNPFLQNFSQGSVGEQLEATGHIFEFCAEQDIGQDTSGTAYKMAT